MNNTQDDRFVSVTELKALGFDYHTHAGKIFAYCLLCGGYKYHYYVAPKNDSQNWWLAVCDGCNRYHDRGNYVNKILRFQNAQNNPS